MTPRQALFDLYDRFYSENKCLFTRKNKDYNSDKDPLSGFRKFGAIGIATRMEDKFGRLVNLLQRGKAEVADESIKDTLMDIANYCFLMHAVLEDEKTNFIQKANQTEAVCVRDVKLDAVRAEFPNIPDVPYIPNPEIWTLAASIPNESTLENVKFDREMKVILAESNDAAKLTPRELDTNNPNALDRVYQPQDE